MGLWTTWGQEMDRPMDKRSDLNTVKHVLAAHRKLAFVVLLIHCATTGHRVPPWEFSNFVCPCFCLTPTNYVFIFGCRKRKLSRKHHHPQVALRQQDQESLLRSQHLEVLPRRTAWRKPHPLLLGEMDWGSPSVQRNASLRQVGVKAHTHTHWLHFLLSIHRVYNHDRCATEVLNK